MIDEAFANFKEAMEGALAFERGERRDLKGNSNSGSPPTQSYVTKRHCSHPTKAKLLASGVCNDAEHQS